jgi:hypothetical protein
MLFSIRPRAFLLCTLLCAIACDPDDDDAIAAYELDSAALDEDRPLRDDDGHDSGDPLPDPEIDLSDRVDPVPCAAPRPIAIDPGGFDPSELGLDLAALDDAEGAPAPTPAGPSDLAIDDGDPEPCPTEDDDELTLAD